MATETTPAEETSAEAATTEAHLEALLDAVPQSAEKGEAAAIAAALGAHLRDRAVTSETNSAPEPCNRWKLCGRLRGRTPPKTVAHGEEWKAAARSRW